MKTELQRLYEELNGIHIGFEREVYMGHSSSHECVIEPRRWNRYYQLWCQLIADARPGREEALKFVENTLATYAPDECAEFCDGPLELKRPRR